MGRLLIGNGVVIDRQWEEERKEEREEERGEERERGWKGRGWEKERE